MDSADGVSGWKLPPVVEIFAAYDLYHQAYSGFSGEAGRGELGSR